MKHIHLDTSAKSSVRDVSTFLARHIAEIVEQNDLNVLEWPGEERMIALLSQASGFFIWAVTTTKFIQDQVAAECKECLNDVLDLLNSQGMGDINTLYGSILHLTYKNQTDPWAFERFRRIVGCIGVLQQPLCHADMKPLLDLRKTATSEPVDIEHHVRRPRTVLIAGTDATDGNTVPRLHKSMLHANALILSFASTRTMRTLRLPHNAFVGWSAWAQSITRQPLSHVCLLHFGMPADFGPLICPQGFRQV